MKRFILTLQFLTRVTVAKNLPYDEKFNKGIIFFPLVGLVLGLILAVIYMGLSYLFNSTITSMITIASYIALTGGLHLDGLGDTFDGFYSSRGKERILEIMKDSRLGTNGVIAVLFSILIKVFVLAALPHEKALLALILMPVLGRLGIVYGCFRISYARETGLGHIYINNVSSNQLMIATGLGIAITLIDRGTLLFIPIAWIFSYLFKSHSKKIIHGMTGDTLGALCELNEILYLLYLVGKLNLTM
ncbi:cobalamin-5'-phosphate synthase [Natronincola peptidivorans]|uniref:Adenosylcobinamide-GDP ribazoletransferase n=1 Tax=Natronincola peptidivorans TaxID=426128 RepID=A0A1I0DJU2_9FIRM|nr:adenosylcobinamide-GDP ribazoletransferase [Natronincola peptidivorans]SET32614.1 cobalamin-5'-phosphate synthase [Natronincola peptidivorans]